MANAAPLKTYCPVLVFRVPQPLHNVSTGYILYRSQSGLSEYRKETEKRSKKEKENS